MDKALKTAAGLAMNRLADHSGVVGLPNTDESTFRSFFLLSLKQLLPAAQCETEWKRVDLLIRHTGENTLLEFKYYPHRRTMGLDGSLGAWKGGPGPKNYQEFCACIEQLRGCAFKPVHAKYLILVYERKTPRNSRHCFSRSYDQLVAEGPVLEVTEIRHRMRASVTCKLLRIA